MLRLLLIWVMLVCSIGLSAQCTFTFSPSNPCPGEKVTFKVTNPEKGASYTWDLFGNNTFKDGTDTVVVIEYPYADSPISYTIKLKKNSVECTPSQSINVKAGNPAEISVTSGGKQAGKIISNCNGGNSATLSINNTTKNPQDYSKYSVNWGDGSPAENYTHLEFGPSNEISHTYPAGAGYNNITITSTHVNGCIFKSEYQYFRGSNPDIGLSSVGSTTGLCAPDSLKFDVEKYENNAPGTTYQFYINNTKIGPEYVHGNLPNPFTFVHLFDESTCDSITPDKSYKNALAVKVVANNPCDSKAAIVQPIRLSTKPNPDFKIENVLNCPNEIFTFTNTTTNINEILPPDSECVDTLNANWKITPGINGVDWEIVSGALFNYNIIKVKFTTPGTYTIRMNLNPAPICGAEEVVKTITVLEPPVADATAMFSNSSGCLPLTVTFNNKSTGYQISYDWTITPPSGWNWQPGGGNGSSSLKDPVVKFTDIGNYLVTLKVTNVCATDIWTDTVKVKDKPIVVLPNFDPFCIDAVLDFTGNKAPTYDPRNGTISAYSWSFPSGNPSSSSLANPTGIKYGPVSKVTLFPYSVTVTNECGSSSASDTIEIQIPETLVMPKDTIVCIDSGPLQLNATPKGGTWSGSGVSATGLFTPSNAGGAGPKKLTYKYGNGICSSEGSLTITVAPLPVVNSGASQSVCLNDPDIPLNGTPAGGNWIVSSGGVLNGNTFSPSKSGAGVYTLTYTYTDVNGCKANSSHQITVKALPTVNATPLTFCNVSGYVALTGGTPIGGKWSGQGVLNNQFDPVIAGGVGTYTLTYTYTDPATGCSSSVNVVITVTNLLSIYAGPDTSFCINAPAYDLSQFSNPTNGQWSFSGQGLSGSKFTPASAGEGTHRLIYSLGTGNCLVRDTVVITVFPLPVITVTLPSAVCVSDSLINLVASPLGGTWMVSPVAVLNGSQFFPAQSGPGNYQFTYTYKDNNGCSNTAGKNIVVHALPVITANDSTYCLVNQSLGLPYAQPVGGAWSGPGITGNAFNPVQAGGAGMYSATYSWKDPNTSCSNNVTVNLHVILLDSINAGKDTSFCVDALPYDLNVPVFPKGGKWSSNSKGLKGNFFHPADAGPGMHLLTYSVGQGNCLVEDNLTITVWALPNVDAGVDLKLCIDQDSVMLNGNPLGGTWSISAGGVLNGSVFNPSLSGAGTYVATYTFTDGNGCSNLDTRQLTVNDLPILSSSDTSYCLTPGDVSLPEAKPTGGSWSGPGVSGNKFNPSSVGLGTTQATYTYTDPTTGCSNANAISISVIQPDVVNAGTDTALCISVPFFNLNDGATPAGGVWTSNGSGLSGNQFIPAQAGPGAYVITYTVGNGNCAVTDTRNITVHPLPIVDAGDDIASCVDEEAVELMGKPNGGSWTSSSGILNGNEFLPSMSGPGNYVLTYSYTDGNGCLNSDSLKVTVHSLPVVIVADTIYCNTPGSVELPSSSPIGGIWDGPGVNSQKFDPIAAGGVGIYSLVYSYTDPLTGCINRDTSMVEVISPVVVDAGPDSAFCLNAAPYDLNVFVSPVGGDWIGQGLTNGVFIPTLAGIGNHLLVYSYGTGNCRVSDTISVEVWDIPKIELDVPINVCVNETAVILDANPDGGVWTSVPMAVIQNGVFDPSVSGVGKYQLFYSFTDSNGCTNTDSLVTEVRPLPEIMVGDTTYCNTPGAVDLPFTVPSGGIWSGSGVSGVTFDPQMAGGVGTYNATYHFKDNFGCEDSLRITIDVISPPVVMAGADDTICINTGFHVLDDFTPTSGGIWAGSGISDPSNAIFDPIQAGGGLHVLEYSFGTGNCRVVDTKSILVISADIEAGPDLTFCLDGPTYSLKGFQPSGGVWSGSGITNASGTFLPELAGVGTHVLNYTFTDGILGCEFRDSLEVTINPMPESDFSDPENSCINEEISFVNLSQNSFKSTWDFGDGSASTLKDPKHIYSDTGTYIVKLISTTPLGCTDSIFKAIFVMEPPVAFFSMAPDSGCAILQVDFNNMSGGFETSYQWDFGNGQSSLNYDPGIISFEQGSRDTIYYISLKAKNFCAEKIWNDSVKVFPWPQVNFGINLDTVCNGAFVGFSNITLGNPDSFFWDFGNGETSTDSIPPMMNFFTDTTYRTYIIRLIATNECGSDTLEKPLVVKPAEVTAFFNIPNDVGCEPYEVEFTNFATLGTDVFWDFGDGNTSNLYNPKHIYYSPGTYTVTQKVTSGCGFHSTTANIVVLPAPEISFLVPIKDCLKDSVQIVNTSGDSLSATFWDFGDGYKDSLYSPLHAWSDTGSFKVTLVGISSINGCPSIYEQQIIILPLPVISFEPDKSDGCPPLTISFQNQSVGAKFFEWDFGDTNTSNGLNSSHTYTKEGKFAVKLTGIDVLGCRNDSTYYPVIIHPIPNPAFDFERDRLCGLPVNITVNNQTPDAVAFTWSFGNGKVSTVNNPNSQYEKEGDYLIELTATNAFGCIAKADHPFVAYAQPEADFIWDPEIGCDPLAVQFSNLSTYGTNYTWEFNSGIKANDKDPKHIFKAPGVYGATLIVSHRDVCFDTLKLENIIEVLPSPKADFDFVEIPTPVPSGQYAFTDLSVDAISWKWNFGDGGESMEQNPSHRYFSNGPKIVTLIVTSINGCTDTITKIVTPTGLKGLFIPSAFVARLDNKEFSYFMPKGVGLKEYNIEVYSSYGQLLWSSDRLEDGRPTEFWDGTFKGDYMPQDVYVWKVVKAIFEDGTVWPGNYDTGKNIGTVTLIR